VAGVASHGALAVAQLIAETVKYFAHRQRPDHRAIERFLGLLLSQRSRLVGLALWLSLAQVIGEVWPDGKAFLLTIASVAAALIGWSQVFLGLNWPADVLAGWAFALLMIAALPGPYRRRREE